MQSPLTNKPMENKDWREEFEDVFYAIMGLETDP